jgi:hypothetical protein
VDLNFHFGIALIKALQVMRQKIAQDGVRCSNCQCPFHTVLLAWHSQRVIDSAQNGVGVAQKPASCLGQFNPMRLTVKQFLLQQVFEVTDGGGDGRLGNVELNRGLGNATQFGSGSKIPELTYREGHGMVGLLEGLRSRKQSSHFLWLGHKTKG